MFNGTVTSDSDISFLIKCPKIFRSSPRSPSRVNRNVSQSFSVYSRDASFKFDIFITYSELMVQDFSLGLRYQNMLLLRCNGFHGTTRSGFFIADHHAYPHWHMLSMSDIQKGRSLKPSNIQDMTGKYFDLQTATAFFFEECAIIDYERYFPVNQVRFPEV